LQQIEARVRELRSAVTAARTGDDRSALASAERDLRYWTQRLESAELVHPLDRPDTVRFGTTVTVDAEDGEHTFEIVGEDESDPKAGRISYVSPIATALLGAHVGDDVKLGAVQGEVTAIR
jgi:transcription elongation GreA/GreB family factor